jgi:hypothetical protein
MVRFKATCNTQKCEERISQFEKHICHRLVAVLEGVDTRVQRNMNIISLACMRGDRNTTIKLKLSLCLVLNIEYQRSK